MFETVVVQRLSAGTIYKLWFIGMGMFFIPVGVLCGLFALFGYDTVTVDRQHLHGLKGMLVGPLIGVVFSLACAALLGSASALGLWVYSKCRPLTLRIKSRTHRLDDEPLGRAA